MLLKFLPITLLASVALGHAHGGLHARHNGHGHVKAAGHKNEQGHHNGTKPEFHLKKNGTHDEGTTTSTTTTTNTHTKTLFVAPEATEDSGSIVPVPEKAAGGACKKPVTVYDDYVVTVTAAAGSAPSIPAKAPIVGDEEEPDEEPEEEKPAPKSPAAAAPSKPANFPGFDGGKPKAPFSAAPSKSASPGTDNGKPKVPKGKPFPISNSTAPLVTDPAVASPTTLATVVYPSSDSVAPSSYSSEAWPLSPPPSEAPPAPSAQPAFVEPSGSWLESYASASASAPASSDSVVVVYQTVDVVPVPADPSGAPAGRRARAVRRGS